MDERVGCAGRAANTRSLRSPVITRERTWLLLRSDAPDAFGFNEVEVVNDDGIRVIETWARSDEERRVIVSGVVWERMRSGGADHVSDETGTGL